MKKHMFLLISTVWLHCMAYTQDYIALTAPLHVLIDSAAKMHHRYTKYIGNKPQTECYMTYSKATSFESLLNYLFCTRQFAYTLKGDTAYIEAGYYHYDLNGYQPQKGSIYTYYDTLRSTKIIAFNKVAPELLLDSLLLYQHPTLKNGIRKKSEYTVSGLLPLSMNVLELLLITHQWSYDCRNIIMNTSALEGETIE